VASLKDRRLDRLPTWADKDVLHVIVESPRGSGWKLKYAPELGAMSVSRPLPLGVVFPFDFGFAPSTKAEDGDPLDIAILVDVGTYPGLVVPSRLIGILRASQKGEGARVRNDRLVAVAAADRRQAHRKDASDLPAREREEIEAFFAAAVALEGKELELLGWGDAREAKAAVEKARLPRKRRR
jgi:inorganic pyrophosphatase